MRNELMRQRIHRIVERDGLIDDRHPALQKRSYRGHIIAFIVCVAVAALAALVR